MTKQQEQPAPDPVVNEQQALLNMDKANQRASKIAKIHDEAVIEREQLYKDYQAHLTALASVRDIGKDLLWVESQLRLLAIERYYTHILLQDTTNREGALISYWKKIMRA